jgi:hypothetical protein
MTEIIFPSNLERKIESLIGRDGVKVDIVDSDVRVHTHNAILQAFELRNLLNYMSREYNLVLSRVVPIYYKNLKFSDEGHYDAAGICWEFTHWQGEKNENATVGF